MMALIALKQYLIDLNYPNINILTFEQVADVFHSSNRIFLITWVFNQLGVDNLSTENFILEKELIMLMSDFGFCMNSQSADFIKNNSNLELEDVLVIIERILKYLIQVKTSGLSFAPILTSEEVQEFVEMDVNLFPSFGLIKLSKLGEECRDIEENKKEINSLKSDVRILNEELKHELQTILIATEPDFTYLKNVLVQMQQVKQRLVTIRRQPSRKSPFNFTFSRIMEKCFTYITVISQNTSNKCSAVGFKKEFLNKIIQDIDELNDSMGKISVMSNVLM